MKIHKYLILCGVLLLLSSCTTKSDTYYNRQFQMIPTMYNVLYNGNLAFEEGKQEIESKYEENYFDILPVEPLQISQEVSLLGEENPHFDRAEEKAIKAIQKHSMVFDGKQKNKKIDDAYMLLGKARYYNQRFVPAIEAFEHLLINYGETNLRNQAAIWREKTNIRLGKHQIAIDNLQKLITTSKLNKKELSEAQAVMGQSFIELQQFENAVNILKLAGKNTTNKLRKGRYYFITGQLYEKLHQPDSAVGYFQKVIDLNRKIPRKLWMEAQFGKVRNEQLSEEQQQNFVIFLKKLQNQYENKKFLDLLYFQQALMYQNNEKEAISLYLKSLENNKGNVLLRQKSHLRLAELYFSQKKYVQSHQHYDSTLVFIPQNTLEYLYTRRKRDNLTEVALQESVVKKTDSILRLAQMTPKERKDFLKKYADSLQKKSNQSVKNEDLTDWGTSVNVSNESSSTFYFANTSTIAYGKQIFKKQFGNRPLVDNWRWSSMITPTLNPENISENQSDNSFSETWADVSFSEQEIRAIIQEQNQSLYRLGVIYSDKFSDNDLAISRLEKLLKNNPHEDLHQQTLYQLYRIYAKNQPEQSDFYKNKLINDFPNSVYAQTLTQNSKLTQVELQQKITELESYFEEQKFVEIIHLIDAYKPIYKTTAFAPDWDLLRAKAQGRLEGVVRYKKLLEELKQMYPNTQLLEDIENTLNHLPTDAPHFLSDHKATSWKIVYDLANQEQLSYLKEMLETYGLAHIKITNDVYDYTQKWTILHGFFDKNQAIQFVEKINSDKKNRFLKELFLISSENYSIIQIYKNKDQYKK